MNKLDKQIEKILRQNFDRFYIDGKEFYGKGETQLRCEVLSKIIVSQIKQSILPSSKNNWWGLGADEYYQGVIEGIVKAFKRLFYTYVVITVLVALVLSLIK